MNILESFRLALGSLRAELGDLADEPGEGRPGENE